MILQAVRTLRVEWSGPRAGRAIVPCAYAYSRRDVGMRKPRQPSGAAWVLRSAEYISVYYAPSACSIRELRAGWRAVVIFVLPA